MAITDNALNRTLNNETLTHLKAQHPLPERFEDFVKTCQSPPRQAIRINTSRVDSSSLVSWGDKNGWAIESIPWCDEGFFVNHANDKSLGNHILHLAGFFYIQEATSMLPVAALTHNHQPNIIADIAAAPGSKTTQLATHITNDGFIVANDMSSSRLKMLNANLIRQGVSNFGLLNKDGATMDQILPPVFDSILLDAPCGGEGTIRKDKKAWDNWSESSLRSLSDVQKSLITTAWSLLAPGGRLVYSTCSLSRQENQEVVEHLMSTCPDEANLVDLSNLFEGAEKISTNGMLHVWPEVFDTEGFFVACLQKSSADRGDYKLPVIKKHRNNLSKKDEEAVLNYFHRQFGITLEELNYELTSTTQGSKQHVWLEVERPEGTNEIQFQRHGIRLATLIPGRRGLVINTHHEFIRCYGQLIKKGLVELTNEQCVAYFQGKNIEHPNATDKGEVILTFMGQTLGLGKIVKAGNIKNQLPRELVHDNAWY